MGPKEKDISREGLGIPVGGWGLKGNKKGCFVHFMRQAVLNRRKDVGSRPEPRLTK